MKKKRISLDLDELSAKESEHIRSSTNLSYNQMSMAALKLLSIYVQTKQQGKELQIIDLENPKDQAVVELPIIIEEL